MVDITKLQIKIFRNPRAEENPKAPPFTGILCDPAQGYEKVAEFSCWYADDRETGEKRMDKNGNPFLSGKTQEPWVPKK